MRKIGVTGGTGFIGRYLLKEGCDKYEFVVLTSGKSDRNRIESPNVNYVVGDYSLGNLEDVFCQCDAIVHLGARRSSPENENAFHNYYDNLEFSENVFSVARDLGIDNVVNISSTAVYDDTLKAPFYEEMAVAPINFYGVSKRTIELIATMYNKKYDMNIKSLRLAQVIGAGERAGYILSVFTDLCKEGKKLPVYGKGRSGKEYIYVKDVVRAIFAAVENAQSRGIYNIGSGVFTPNRQLAEAFCSAFDNKAGIEYLMDKKEVVRDYYMDVSRARDEIGFSCAYDLESALLDLRSELEASAHGKY